MVEAWEIIGTSIVLVAARVYTARKGSFAAVQIDNKETITIDKALHHIWQKCFLHDEPFCLFVLLLLEMTCLGSPVIVIHNVYATLLGFVLYYIN